MLIVLNGAYKSGSTWLYNIVLELTGYGSPPQEFLNPEWKEPSLLPDRAAKALTALRSSDLWLVKNHFHLPEHRTLLLSRPDVRVLDITRDLRDVVVSSYYHDRRALGFTGTFEEYYWQIGRTFAMKVCRYHALWARPSKQCYSASYEGLHANFEDEIGKLSAFLGIPTTPERLAEIKQRTTLNALRERYGEQDKKDEKEKFFRKGVIGDFANHMDSKMLADLALLERGANHEQTRVYRAIRRLKRLVRVVIPRQKP